MLLNSATFEECHTIQSIVDSLKKWWSKCDQEVFLAAVILNPIYKALPFSQLNTFTNSGIYQLLSQLWTRFFQQDPLHELLTELFDYLGNTAAYASVPNFLAALKADPIGHTRVSHIYLSDCRHDSNHFSLSLSFLTHSSYTTQFIFLVDPPPPSKSSLSAFCPSLLTRLPVNAYSVILAPS